MMWFGIASYGAAGLTYVVTTAALLGNDLGRPRRRWLLVALGMSAVWACGILLLTPVLRPTFGFVALDVLHSLAWVACVLSWLSASRQKAWLLGGAAALGAVAIGSAVFVTEPMRPAVVYPLLVAVALLGFLAAEQVYRNAEEQQRRALLPLCLATGCIFVVDVCVYSQARLLDLWPPFLFDVRGLVNAVLAPLILVAVKRNADADRELVVSRQVAFYTASLLGVGIYLLAMLLAAYLIRRMSEWSVFVELLFFVAALGLLLFVLFSTNIRRYLGALFVKHFYGHKYDYRREWLRLTQNLGRGGDLLTLAANGLEGLARIVGSSKGNLWVAREPGRYVWMVSLDRNAAPLPDYELGSPIVRFLVAQGWVIDSDEYSREPDRYGTAFGSPSEALLPPRSLIVPLDCQGYLQGFVIIEKPAIVRTLNFEDHDILKTAGRQVGVALAQALVLEKLAETRQFEAMNRLSTFLMHDLKNIVAQQELILANAQRFRHRPEFIDDTFTTIRSGVERTKRVLEQLHSGIRADAQGPVDVSKVLMEVRSQCADREPIPSIDVAQPAAWVSMDRDKLASALTHLVRNAQDATPPAGEIKVMLERDRGELVVTVSDTGCGMAADFVRHRLFRPFDSTKGAQGMGIGAYQVRELVRSAGGRLEVVSGVGTGTVFTLRLPLLRAAG